MEAKYGQIYRSQRQALGEPTQAFVDFFAALNDTSLTVLDLGCGQGRDALFIARLGYRVVGVDRSPTAIKQLLGDAGREGLAVEGEVADLTAYQPATTFDVTVLDRVLHMLEPVARREVLARAASHLNPLGYLLIADERKNLPSMRDFFRVSPFEWQVVKDEKALLFVQKGDV